MLYLRAKNALCQSLKFGEVVTRFGEVTMDMIHYQIQNMLYFGDKMTISGHFDLAKFWRGMAKLVS